MNKIIQSIIALSLATAGLVFSAVSTQAEVHSRYKDLVVMGAHDLPEQAQTKGNSLSFTLTTLEAPIFISSSSTANGCRSSMSPTRLVISESLPAEGAFDFVRPLGSSAELVAFRDDRRMAVLDLRKAGKPVFRTISNTTNLAEAEKLGESGLLSANEPYSYVPAVARDYQVLDISAENPVFLATVKDVKHRVTNEETGTTFFLGSEGLTMVRRISIENGHKMRQMQMQGN
jgi:hypothetical protein